MEWKMESIARNGGGPGTLCWRGGFGEYRLYIFTFYILSYLSISWYWHLQLWRGSVSARVFPVFFLIKKMSFDWSSQLLMLYSFYPCLLFKSL